MLRLLMLAFVFAYVTLQAASAQATDAGYPDELSPSLAGGAKAMRARRAELQERGGSLQLARNFRSRAPLLEVILLCDVEEMKYREIAAVVGAPIGTVMSRLGRARGMLREAWLKSEQEPERKERSL